MNPVRKRPAYLFAKDFQISNVLGNLQGYKIATGQLDKEEVEAVSTAFGGDEGLVFGSLITRAGDTTKPGKRDFRSLTANQKTKRRRQKRQRKRQNKSDIKNANTESTTTIHTDSNSSVQVYEESFSIPSSILDYGCSNDEDSKFNKLSDRRSCHDSSKSESSDDEHTNNFFGFSSQKKTEVAQTKSAAECTTTEDTICKDETEDRIHCFDDCQPYPEVRIDQDIWDANKIAYKHNVSTLSTYKCWKCKRIGHLSEDCTVNMPNCSTSGAEPSLLSSRRDLYQDEDDLDSDSILLKEYFKRCQMLRNSKVSKCSTCSARSNLVSCMECGLVLCDGRGHLTNHLVDFPSHTKLYSFKLRRLIKCCKSTCGVVDATKLLMCSTCLSKQFNSHYNMINATWSRSGLNGIPNTLACEKHFQWHRMNCANTMEEPLLCQEKLENAKRQNDGLLSEFYF